MNQYFSIQVGKEKHPKGSFFGNAARSMAAIFFLIFSIELTNGEVDRATQVKAVFLFRLTQFVEWPAKAFESNQSPIIIGVLGENPFGEALAAAIKGEKVGERPLIIRYYRRVEEVQTCHVLFISRSETAKVDAIVAALAGRSILTVSEIEDFVLKHHGMIRFMTEQNKVSLRINLETAKAAGLELSSRLLRVAEVVPKH